ncbi:O-acyltransferase WSD1 [Camellia lanceoleosa]|uniref:O-acyltransferase WSD1 n=1 Tax=Camellia lanceoleosa TaxID=1840588 RepID=A0ACC0HWN8_9ERIC|nr:O-acyltransferase WSD1 [Camellia lanceoleosa]
MDLPDKFVEDYICNLTKSDVDKTKPLWDLHILDIKTSDSEGVIVYRVHHSISDGTSLMALLLACSRKVFDPEALPSIPVMKKSSLIKNSGFWLVLQLVWNTIIGVLLFVATSLFLKDTETPIKASKRVEKNGRRIIVRNVNLDDVKLIMNAMNVAINDVVLGVSEAGLTKYLNSRYALFWFETNVSYASTLAFVLALMIHAISYVNKLIFIISAEEETIPDPHQICDDLEESLNLIKAAVLAKQHVKDD